MQKQKSVGRSISLIHRYTIIHINKKLENYNIGIGQLHFLLSLSHYNAINQEQLANYLKIDKATSARAIRKLEKEGLVKRKINPQDKRSYNIFITKKGRELIPKIRKITKKWTELLFTDFNKNDQEKLFFFLEKITINAEKYK